MTEREFAQITRDPDSSKGRGVVLFGSVVQFDAATGNGTFLADVAASDTSDNMGFFTGTSSLLVGDPSVLSGVLAGDVFRAEVIGDGATTYSAAIGGSRTVPQFKVVNIAVIAEPSGAESRDPSGDVKIVGARVDRWGDVELDVLIINNGSDRADYFVDIAAVSPDGSQQYDTTLAVAEQLEPGQQKSDSASFFGEIPADARFVITEVSRTEPW